MIHRAFQILLARPLLHGARCVLVAAILLCPGLTAAQDTQGGNTEAPAPQRLQTPMSDKDVRRLFDQGNALFRSALEKAQTDKAGSVSLFRDAAAAWRTIALDGHIHNARLEMNIANASLLAGDVPRAIAAFRRGQALDPSDLPIRNGLTAARRAAGTEGLSPGSTPAPSDIASQGGVRGTLHRIGALLADSARRTLLYLPERGLLWIAAASYLIGMAAAGLRTMGSRRLPRWCAAALLTVALLSAAPLVARDMAAEPEGVIIAPGLSARSGPADLYDRAFKEPLQPGLEVQIEERRSDWLRVHLADGREAWVPAHGVEPI